MAFAQSPSISDIYSQAREVKQYQAFVITIPVLFCIMLFVFLYLFLKKQASIFSHPPPLPPTLAQTPSFSFVISVSDVGLKEDVIDKLPTIVFDEELKARETLCSVCLGEFEMKEELIQLPSCKHIFHNDCIRNWLGSKTTCPLCRCSVIVVDNSTKLVGPPPQTSPAVLLAESVLQQQANLADR